MKPKLLICDIDETLIFATIAKLDRREDFRFREYFVYKRPGLEPFLQSAARAFEIAVWTSSSSSYAKIAVSSIFDSTAHLRFVWTREQCTRRLNLESREWYWLKDLKKVKRLGFSLEHVIVVDDSPEKLARNYGNHILVTPFRGDVYDTELSHLQRYLEYVQQVDNVRLIDKRNWRQRVHRAGDLPPRDRTGQT